MRGSPVQAERSRLSVADRKNDRAEGPAGEIVGTQALGRPGPEKKDDIILSIMCHWLTGR